MRLSFCGSTGWSRSTAASRLPLPSLSIWRTTIDDPAEDGDRVAGNTSGRVVARGNPAGARPAARRDRAPPRSFAAGASRCPYRARRRDARHGVAARQAVRQWSLAVACLAHPLRPRTAAPRDGRRDRRDPHFGGGLTGRDHLIRRGGRTRCTGPGGAGRQSASGLGRNWKWKAIGTVPLPPSFSHGTRSPLVVHTPRPFHPALGSSMRPSRPLA